MIEHFIIATLSGIGMATLLVEKGDDFPVRIIRNPLLSLTKTVFGKSWAESFSCTVCMSFWTTLLCEVFMYLHIDASFTWPLSGFAASGIVFYAIDFLNTIDRTKGSK